MRYLMGPYTRLNRQEVLFSSKVILANWIVCLAVRIALRCKEEIAKILVLILVVFIFVYLGFEHSIANMGTFSMAILGGGALTVGEALHNLFYSTLGNVVGGVLLVGLPFTYLNPREREEQMQEVLLVREAPRA
jgi:nitrite transporter